MNKSEGVMLLQSIQSTNSSYALMDKAATKMAKGPQADIVQASVDMIMAKTSAGANIAVLKAANDIQKTIIDILA
jgi:flagellar basal body rod protein FlgC